MKEIGGYIELDNYHLPLLYNDAIKLNCGRKALAYLIEANQIRKMAMPFFMCDSCDGVLQQYDVDVNRYNIGPDFKPLNLTPEKDEWLYLVNFYGQLTNSYISQIDWDHSKIIVDNAQAYFQMPLDNLNTIYSCRKFFGVPDGAMLYSTKLLEHELEQDESFERMHFLLGRFERNASDFYQEYVENNHCFEYETIKRMSKLTENLLRGIDYESVKKVRTDNFAFLHNSLGNINQLELVTPIGAFMYPLYLENGSELRKQLQKEKIYIPVLWPSVFRYCRKQDLEYDMAENILPLPVDQRYGTKEMNTMITRIRQCLKN